MITGTFHSGITVSDLDRSLAFYEGLLGLEVVWRRLYEEDYILRMVNVEGTSGIDAALVRVPGDGHLIELLEYHPARPRDRRPVAGRPCDPAVGHIGFTVEDIHDAARRLTAAGVRMQSEAPQEVAAGANRGGWGLYVLDPDGYIVELHQPAAAAAAAAAG